MECLDKGGRVVAMAAASRALAGKLKAYAALETKPEFLTGLIDAIDEFKRCCITSETLMHAARQLYGSFAQKLEELALLMESYDALCYRGKRDPRDQMLWCLEQLEDSDYAQNHVFYIDGFPDFTRQNLDILELLIRESPSVTVSLNCDRVGSDAMAFEKAGDTAKQLLERARRAGVEVQIQQIPGEPLPVRRVWEALFQGTIDKGEAKDCLGVFRAESPYMEVMGAAEQVRELVRGGCRYRDINLVCGDMSLYMPLVNQVFHRFGIPVYQSGTEDILQKSVVSTVLNALDAALTGFEQRSVLRYLRSALSPISLDECDMVENYAFLWGIRGNKWKQVWENDPEGLGERPQSLYQKQLEMINSARNRAILPLQRLQEGFRNASRLSDQILALYDFLEEIQMDRRLSALAQEFDALGENREAQILNQLWEILITALEQMHDTLGEGYWEPEHFVRLLQL
jgi:ATP-dependent helicase/nuclease subunit B